MLARYPVRWRFVQLCCASEKAKPPRWGLTEGGGASAITLLFLFFTDRLDEIAPLLLNSSSGSGPVSFFMFVVVCVERTMPKTRPVCCSGGNRTAFFRFFLEHPETRRGIGLKALCLVRIRCLVCLEPGLNRPWVVECRRRDSSLAEYKSVRTVRRSRAQP